MTTNITYKEFSVLLFMKSMGRNLTPFDTIFLSEICRKGLFVIMSNLKKKKLVDTTWIMNLGNPNPVFMGWELTEDGKKLDLFKDYSDSILPPKRI